MNVVVEESARTRAGHLERKLQRLSEDLIGLDADLAAIPGRQREARILAITNSPTQHAGKVGSEAAKLAADEKKLRATRENTVLEIEATQAVLAVEHKRRQEEELRPVVIEALALTAQEAEAWKALGALEEQRLLLIHQIFDCAEARDSLRLANEVAVSNCEDPVLKAEASDALSELVTPFPTDTPGVSLTVVEACCDPSRRYREEGEVERLDGRDFLIREMPDLRHLNRVATLSGRAERRYSSKQAQDYGFGNMLPALTV